MRDNKKGTWSMKVGDLVRPNNPSSIHNKYNNHDKLIEIVNIEIRGKRIRLKFHDRITMDGNTLYSCENPGDWVLDIQRMRDRKLNDLGINDTNR